MARLTVVCCLICLAVSSAKQRKILLHLLQERKERSVSRPVSDAAQATFLALDADHSGKLERRELEVFAKSEGLSAEDVASEFGRLDTNGDGELSAAEIMGTLEGNGEPVAQIAAPVATPVAVMDSLSSGSSRQSNLHSDTTAEAMQTPKASTAASLVDAKNESGIAKQAEFPYRSDVADKEGSNPIKGEDILMENAVLQKVKHDAGNILAMTFARSGDGRSQNDTAIEKRALEMEASARLLRGRAESLAAAAQERTLIAASQAANKILEVAKSRVHDLDMRAEQYELQAARHHQQALTALDRIAVSQDQMRTSIASV